MNVTTIIIFCFLVLSLYLGIRARQGKDMSLEEWTVGGRGFGPIVMLVLLAGEIYSTSTFLGTSGWAYGIGGPALYGIAFAALGYMSSYWIYPALWKYGNKHKLVSQADYFVSKYKSPVLGVLVSIVGVLALVPFLVLQLKGLGIIVSTTSYGSISPSMAIWIGAAAVTVYVMISGIHGSVWTAVLKDIMIALVALFLGIYMPLHYFGGIQPMFEAVDAVKPGFLTLPDKGMSVSWFISTVLLTALGFHMWPQTFGSVYTAKSAKVFRKNAWMLPLYGALSTGAMFVGYTAIVQVPGLKGSEMDLALLKLSMQTFDPWFVGIIGAAGLLTALVPGSMILMSASTLLAKNVYRHFSPAASDHQVMKIARIMVPVLALVAVYFALTGGNTIVALLLMGYSFVTQLFPSFIISLWKGNFVTRQGAIAGILAGLSTVAYTSLTNATIGSLFPQLPQVIQDLNIGLVALLINVVVMLVVSVVTKTAPEIGEENLEVAS
ncbi:sodium:solute symporter family protein [Brevibacillus nitrificans]|uniref:Sodium:solute symporter family protein n=1 Tax=Brevibacillus nitrificans TaxID=651560 RepID=A0A3M8DK76_9BACL|nr:sodium:solute symporter [Brevibacillus nitrificans]RNB88456.1 sodium:solute symporter family protein [Brevibacillus nitrificans]